MGSLDEIFAPCTCTPRFTLDDRQGDGAMTLMYGRCRHKHGFNLGVLSDISYNAREILNAPQARIAELENALEAKRMVNTVRVRKLEAENQRLRDAAQAVVDSATPHYDRWVNGVTRVCINRLAALLGGGGNG